MRATSTTLTPSSVDFAVDRVDTWVPTVEGDEFAGRVPELQAGLASGAVDTLIVAAARDLALVRMVTNNPAQALEWHDRVGSIEEGKVADLVVLGDLPAAEASSPYRRLIDATESEVALTMVGGDARAGDVDVMEQLKPDAAELVTSLDRSIVKAVDLTPDALGVAGAEFEYPAAFHHVVEGENLLARR